MNMIQHSVKGSTWKKHKYIRKEGDRYIYDNQNDQDKIDEAEKNVQKYRDRLERQKHRRIGLEGGLKAIEEDLKKSYDSIKDKTLSDYEIEFYKNRFNRYEEMYIKYSEQLESLYEFIDFNQKRLNEAIEVLNDLKKTK